MAFAALLLLVGLCVAFLVYQMAHHKFSKQCCFVVSLPTIFLVGFWKIPLCQYIPNHPLRCCLASCAFNFLIQLPYVTRIPPYRRLLTASNFSTMQPAMCFVLHVYSSFICHLIFRLSSCLFWLSSAKQWECRKNCSKRNLPQNVADNTSDIINCVSLML